MKVLYLSGVAHSGTTILANLLGEAPGLFSGGELHYVWRRGYVENRSCGCGAPFLECDFWHRVREASGPVDRAGAERLARIEERRLLLRSSLRGRRSEAARRELAELAEAVLSLYTAIEQTAGCDVIVDSSKTPTYGAFLASLPGIELHLVQLVRDPRATSYSLQRKQSLSRVQLGKAALVWDAYQLVSDRLARRLGERALRLDYADFAARPRETAERICRLVGLERPALPFLDERTVELGPNHTVSGNRNRFQSGPVSIRADEEWRRAMRASDRHLVGAVTWPVRRSAAGGGNGRIKSLSR